MNPEIQIKDENDGDDCPICWEPLETFVSETECKHRFHTKCLCTSIRKDPLCPLCRRSLIHVNIVTKSHVDLGRFHFEIPNMTEFIYFPIIFLLYFILRIFKFICMETLCIIFIVLHLFFFILRIVIYLVSIPVSIYFLFLTSQLVAALTRAVFEGMNK